jgi:O-antigen/teichoic acid export membrane protein
MSVTAETITTEAKAHSRDRYRRAVLTTIAMFGARGVAIITALVSIPLGVRYLGVDRFGLWMLIVSFLSLLSFADLGLGSGLVNALSDANGRDDVEAAKRYVSTAFFMLFGLVVILGLGFALAYRFIPWAQLFNVTSPEARREAGPAMAVLVACLLISIPLDIVERTQIGYQEGFVNAVWTALGSVLGLAGLLICVFLKTGLPLLILATLGGPVLAKILNGIWLFGRRRPWLLPRWSLASRSRAVPLLKIGVMFFVLQIAVALAFSSDNLVVARIFGSAAVTAYSVPMRLFTFFPALIFICLSPLWPAYGEAIARGDIRWVKRTLLWSTAGVFAITSSASLALIIVGNPLIHLITGKHIVASQWLLIGLGLWTTISATSNAIAMFLNGANVILFQVVFSLIMSVAALGLKIVLAREVGLPGVIWGTLIAYVLFTLIPVVIYLPRLLARLEKRAAGDVTEAPMW